MLSCTASWRSIFAMIALAMFPDSASAHFQGDPGVPCFREENDQIVPIDDPTGGQHYAEIIDARLNPAWVSELQFEDAVHIEIRYRIAHCRPYYVFVDALWEPHNDVAWSVSPSPAYEPGTHEGTHTAFIEFRKEPHAAANAQAAIHGVRINIVEVGTYKQLATRKIDAHVTWHDAGVAGTPLHESEECVDRLVWPQLTTPSRNCSNSTTFTLESGFRIADRLDLNGDGICELIVETEWCRKLGGNTCYLVFAEREDYFKQIWQYYRELMVFGDENGYARLGSTETGPITDVHRYGIYDPVRGRYATRTMIQPCQR